MRKLLSDHALDDHGEFFGEYTIKTIQTEHSVYYQLYRRNILGVYEAVSRRYPEKRRALNRYRVIRESIRQRLAQQRAFNRAYNIHYNAGINDQ